MNTAAASRLLTPTEAAAFLNISRRTLATWLAIGRLPCVRLSARALRIDRVDLERLIAENKNAEGASS